MKLNKEIFAMLLKNSEMKVKIRAKKKPSSSEYEILVIDCNKRQYDIVWSHVSTRNFETIITDFSSTGMKEMKKYLDENGFLYTSDILEK